MKYSAMVGLMAMFAAGLPVHAAGVAPAGQAKSAACAACHGADGNSPAPNFPKLAGQGAAYIEQQLRAFKSGVRPDPTMNGIAAALSDQDMADLAAYYAGQKRALAGADKALVTRGERLYRGGDKDNGAAACMACHGPNGSGNPAAKYPALSGQHAAYVEKQLNDFRAGTRSGDGAGMMHDIAIKLTPEEIKAVSAYVQGLR